MNHNEKSAMSDLERVKRSYSTGSQTYTPPKKDENDNVRRSEDQQNSKHGQQYPLPSRV